MYTWRSLTEADLPALAALSRRVLAEDGGLPIAGDPPFLQSRYLTGASTAAVQADELVAAAGLRPVGDQLAAIGVVDPAHRGHGLGTRLVTWARQAGTGASVRFETESLTAAADALFGRHGLQQSFAEDVMRRDLTAGGPEHPLPAGVTLTPWSAEVAPRFYAVYRAAFADRPGGPDWSASQWIAWISEDDEFAPQWTMLASRYGADVGFIAGASGATGAWVVQVGVVPAERGSGLGAGLTAGALRRMRGDGETQVFLDVNINNPTAARVYERLGFVVVGRRARYES